MNSLTHMCVRVYVYPWYIIVLPLKKPELYWTLLWLNCKYKSSNTVQKCVFYAWYMKLLTEKRKPSQPMCVCVWMYDKNSTKTAPCASKILKLYKYVCSIGVKWWSICITTKLILGCIYIVVMVVASCDTFCRCVQVCVCVCSKCHMHFLYLVSCI